MDPHTFSVAQLKWVLGQKRLSTQGRKVELIQRLQVADPTGGWMSEVNQSTGVEEDSEERTPEGPESAKDGAHQERQADEYIRRENELIRRERDLLQREIQLMRRENEGLRMSPNNSTVSATSRTTTSIKSISELVSEYKGSEEDFKRWNAQINLLRATYELDENTSKILVGSKLKGKALEWYHSRADHLAMGVDELLNEMQSMFERPLGRLELRKKFEAREWQKNELFSEYCHHKLILGNRVPVAKEEMVDYVIEGIPSEALRNQARMHLFSSVQEMMKAFSKVTLKSEQGATSRDVNAARGATRKQWRGPAEEKSKEVASKNLKINSKEAQKCYEWAITPMYAHQRKWEVKNRK